MVEYKFIFKRTVTPFLSANCANCVRACDGEKRLDVLNRRRQNHFAVVFYSFGDTVRCKRNVNPTVGSKLPVPMGDRW